MTDQEKKDAWEKGQKALARIMKYVKVEKVEALADRIENKEFRESVTFKMFLNSLK